MRHLLRQLIDSCSTIGDDLIDYFARKLTSLQRQSGLLVTRWSHSNSLQIRHRTLIIIGDSADWSLIEVQLQLGIIVHYKHCLVHVLHDDTGCHHCREISAAADKFVSTNREIVPRWKYRAEILPGLPEFYGLSLLWTLHLRQGFGELLPTPLDYRSALLHELLVDMKAADKGSLLPGNGSMTGHARPIERGISPVAGLQAFWLNFGEQQGFGTRLWNKVLQLNGEATHGFSLGRASELLRIALSIAAPDVLIDIKGCLREIRSWRELAQDSFKPPWDKCDVSISAESKCLFGIRRRISAWRSYCLKKRWKECRRYTGHNGSREKGAYWDHLVQHVGGGNPNILCLIPRRAIIFPPSTACSLNTNSYRDLAISECKVVGRICEEFRPGVVSAIDADLRRAFFSLKEPPCRYNLEEWSNRQILGQWLSSNFVWHAFTRRDS